MINYKVLLLGSANTGKTAYLKKYIYGLYPKQYQVTFGVNYGELQIIFRKQIIALSLFDISSEQIDSQYLNVFFLKANAAMIFFDANQLETIETAIRWKKLVESKYQSIPCILVGNKLDVTDKINLQDLQFISNQNGFLAYYLISVKNDISLDDPIKLLLAQHLDMLAFLSDHPKPTICFQLGSMIKKLIYE